MRVVVFGASGVQGAAQVSALAAAGHLPVAVSRHPPTTPHTTTTPARPVVEARAADFSDRASLRAALSGADAVFLNLPSTSFQPPEPVIAAARAIGEEAAAAAPALRLLVFNTSMPVPARDHGIEAQEHRREMRRLLREATRGSGVAVVSIQPVAYLDNLLEGWALPRLRDEGRVVYCHRPGLEVSWLSHDDLAALMVAALSRAPADLDGRDFAVGGPETVTLPQLTERLGRAWGREVGYEHQGVGEFAEEMGRAMEARSGLPRETVAEQMHRAYTWYNEAEEKPFKVDMGPVLRELPAQLTGIEGWARRKGCPIHTA